MVAGWGNGGGKASRGSVYDKGLEQHLFQDTPDDLVALQRIKVLLHTCTWMSRPCAV
jgi:hypothetical protein